MKIIVTGVKGQLGYDIVKALENDHDVIGIDYQQLDLCDNEKTTTFILNHQPQVVIHCAAYTAVDLAEEQQKKCFSINVDASKTIATACKKINATMIYFSTDYVFSGEGTCFYKEDDVKQPINVYGHSKFLGELAVSNTLDKYFIFRISWVFGINGNNFVKTMLKLAKTNNTLTIINDQIGSPTYTVDVATMMKEIINSNHYGTYHLTNEGTCSWYEFAQTIFKLSNINIVLVPILTKNYPTKAKRPLNSRLDKTKLSENGFNRLPSWKNALERYILELNNAQN